MSNESLEHRAKRLRYRSWRRGTKELDLLLGPFADTCFDGSGDGGMDTYEVLLELPEPLIYSLLTGVEQPDALAGMPEDFAALVGSIRAFHAKPEGSSRSRCNTRL